MKRKRCRRGECHLKKRKIAVVMMAYTVLLVTSVNTYKEQLNHPIMSDVGKLLPNKNKNALKVLRMSTR